VRHQGDLNGKLTSWAAQPDVLVNEAREMLNSVQKRLNFQLHSWSSWLIGSIDRNTDRITEDQPFFHHPQPSTLQAPVVRSACGSGDKALQECNLSTEPSMDCSNCIPPGSGQFPDRVFAF
jgi:hypothetical protein